jgi:hypothetical protein
MVKNVAEVLPPLSNGDNIMLCVMLPLLSAALQVHLVEAPSEAEAMDSDEATMEDTLLSISQPLAEYALSTDYDSKARSAAASCLHATIASICRDRDCPALPIVTDVINTSLRSALAKYKAATRCSSVIAIKDSFNLLSLVVSFICSTSCREKTFKLNIAFFQGSAAACRGGKSPSAAANIALFLVDLACLGKTSVPVEVDFSKFDTVDSESLSTELEIAAASAYGSMLSVEAGSPFMKQRLTHITLKHVRSAFEEERDQAVSGIAVKPPRLGLLAIVCHIVCCSNVQKMESSTLRQLSTIAVEGLSSRVFSVGDSSDKLYLKPMKMLVLASVVKLVSVAPASVSSKSSGAQIVVKFAKMLTLCCFLFSIKDGW